jgi:hypothetical protein
MIRTLGAALLLFLMPLAAAAQTSGAAAPDLDTPQISQGPMVVERIHNGFLAAPDFKITEVEHRTSGLAGGYAGVVFADTFFIGGGGYGLVTDRRGRELAYGGLVMQWFARRSEPFGYSAKMLVGGGRAESTASIQVMDRGRIVTQSARVGQDFFVFEPEVSALVRLTSQLRLTVGAGYRFTGSDWGHHGSSFTIPGTRLNGAVGSIGLQIGGGS